MFYKVGKKFLGKEVDLYFGESGRLYISGPLGITSNKLFFSFDMVKRNVERSSCNSVVRRLFSLLNFLIFSTRFGYYILIDLVGLGYKLRKLTNLLYRFYLGQSHFIYVYIPKDVILWAFQNRIALFSIYADKLFSLSSTIMLLRKLNAYKLRGLIRPGQLIILKEGKQR